MNTRQINRHLRKVGISTNRSATGEASPQSLKTWDSSLNALETILVPGHYFVMHCGYATIWAFSEATPIRSNLLAGLMKLKSATNARFNSWRLPTPYAFALERRLIRKPRKKMWVL